jgi:hypothetical protein
MRPLTTAHSSTALLIRSGNHRVCRAPLAVGNRTNVALTIGMNRKQASRAAGTAAVVATVVTESLAGAFLAARGGLAALGGERESRDVDATEVRLDRVGANAANQNQRERNE